ncbi:MAG: TspO/MBR family protein [Blautia sp.]|jgi:benzodiazapine receptor
MEKIQWKPLLVSLVISLGTGVIGGLLTFDSMKKYEGMYHPPLAPPGWVFPVVWTILYLLMGIAAYLVYLSDSEEKYSALRIYGVQLLVNMVWPLLFFRFEAYLLAFTWLILLWYLIKVTTKQFYQIDKTAGKLMVPYLLWVTFAGYLNLAIAVYYLFH